VKLIFSAYTVRFRSIREPLRSIIIIITIADKKSIAANEPFDISSIMQQSRY